MRSLFALFPLLTLLAACSGAITTNHCIEAKCIFLPIKRVRGCGCIPLRGDFACNPNTSRFIDKMVQEHGFDCQKLHALLEKTKRQASVVWLMNQQAPTPITQTPDSPNGSWLRYRNKFITEDNVKNGAAFWKKYKVALERAWKIYGVPPEIIVGIIGVETRWGRVMGKTRVIDALATLAFDYTRRSDYFAEELEALLLISHSEGSDPLELRGSFAGALGYGQFMPSSYKRYAVDFNGDNHINLWEPVDAIGSIANYFRAHGWIKGDQVAVQAYGQAASLKPGLKARYSIASLALAGLIPHKSLGDNKQAILLRLDIGTGYQYWYGLPNFYIITRYNHSTYYAMAVCQLGTAVLHATRFKIPTTLCHVKKIR